MAEAAEYKQVWERNYREAYTAGKRHWRPEAATPAVFAEFLKSQWAPGKGARVLEAGCGDGLNAIYLARHGYRVTGVDVVEAAIERAREAAAEVGVEVEFLGLDLARDETELRDYELWVDIKTLHCLWEDADRRRYLAAAAAALREGGVLFLNCALALADVREHFPQVFAALDEKTRSGASVLDRDLPREQRSGIRCETLEWYCQEIEQAGFEVCEAKREASLKGGWGAVVVGRKKRGWRR